MASVSGFKIPAAWDQNRPKFDGETANSLRNFLRHCEIIFTSGSITDEQEKKEKLLEYVDHSDIREQWEKLRTFKDPITFAKWKEEIVELFPEIEDMAQGSLSKLNNICQNSTPISRDELGKLRRFSLAFENEAEKLMKGSALVVNLNLVEMILKVLDPVFAEELENTMNQAAIVAIYHPVVAAAGQANGLSFLDRRGDRLPYKQVLKMADHIANNWVGRSSKRLLNGGSRSDLTAGLGMGMVPIAPSETVKIKQEIANRLDTFAGELAQIKDSADVRERRLGESLKRLESSFESTIRQLSQSSSNFNQTSRQLPPHMDQSAPTQKQRYDHNQEHNHGSRSGTGHDHAHSGGAGPCFFCNGPHYVNECDKKDGFIDRGLVIIENGLIKLGNGNWIPKYPEQLSRMQKVEDYYRKIDGGKNLPPVQQANMVQTFYSGHSQGSFSQYDPYHEDRVGNYYDTLDDEIRSAKVQQVSRLRAANQMLEGSSKQSYQVPAVPMSSPQVPIMGTNMAQIMPQFQQIPYTQEVQPVVQSNVPVVPVNNGVDLNQLIQFMNILNSSNRTGTPVQDQMVMTRGGSRTDPAPESKN